MSMLIAIVLFGLGFAVFATQNTSLVSISLGNFMISLPLYLLVLGSLLSGLVVSGLISLFGSIATYVMLRSKESNIKAKDSQLSDLSVKIHQLEQENANLKATADAAVDESAQHESQPPQYDDKPVIEERRRNIFRDIFQHSV